MVSVEANATYSMAIAGTPNAIDLTPYRTLYIDSYGNKGSASGIAYDINLAPTKAVDQNRIYVSYANSSRELHSYDITAIDTEMYIAFNAFNGRKAYLYNLYLE